MDDGHGCGPPEAVKVFMGELGELVQLKWEKHELGTEYSHLHRHRTQFRNHVIIRPNEKYVKEVLRALELEDCKPVATPSAIGYRPTEEDGEFLSQDDATLFRSCAGSLLHVSIDREDIQ